MNLPLFFRPIAPEAYQTIEARNSFFHSIKAYTETFPDYETADIALVGLMENRGTKRNAGVDQAADAVRKRLYTLKKGSGAYKIVDLGNLVNGDSLEETYSRIREVGETLIQHQTLPIFIGGSHDLDYGQYQAYQDLETLVSVLSVDASIDIIAQQEKGSADDESKNHLHQILVHEPNYLLNYSHIAYQSYLVDANAPKLLDKFYFDTHRLGHVTDDLASMEPTLRNADMLSFDITAIRSEDAPGNAHAQPFGLTGQQSCQLCWYAGHSEKLTSAGFYEYNPAEDDARQKTASVVAIMMWYLIEGYYHRTYEENFESHNFIKYHVPMPAQPEQITFYKARKSEKWWMEVPNPSVEALKSRRSIVPCDPADYHRAIEGELPDRWIQTHAKYL